MTIENRKFMKNILGSLAASVLAVMLMAFIVLPAKNEKTLIHKEGVDNVQNQQLHELKSITSTNSSDIKKVEDNIKVIEKEMGALVTKEDLDRAKEDIKDLIRSVNR